MKEEEAHAEQDVGEDQEGRKPIRLKYGLARPMYGPPHPVHCRTLLREIVTADRRGFAYVGDISPIGSHLVAARNGVVKRVLREEGFDIEGVLWVDSDIAFPKAGILAGFLEGIAERKLHFAAGCYYVKSQGHRPTWGAFGGLDTDGFYEINWQDGPGLEGWERIPGGACGFGLTWTSLELLRAIGPGDATMDSGFGPFSKLPQIAEPGDDYSFCKRVAELEEPLFDLWLDHDCQLAHCGMDGIITQEHFVQAQINNHSKALDADRVEKEGI